MANRHFDGSGDRINFGSDASLDDFTSFSFAFWAFSTGYINNSCLVGKNATEVTGGWSCIADNSVMALQMLRNWSGGLANFISANNAIANSTRQHVAVTYDGSNAANAPTIYVDGVVSTLSTNAPSSGTPTSDATNSLQLGQDGSNSNDALMDVIGFLYHNAVLTAGDVNRARWWGRPFGGLKVYHPFVTDKLANEGTATADGTVTGATQSNAFVPPMVRPGSATMGMGIGW